MNKRLLRCGMDRCHEGGFELVADLERLVETHKVVVGILSACSGLDMCTIWTN